MNRGSQFQTLIGVLSYSMMEVFNNMTGRMCALLNTRPGRNETADILARVPMSGQVSGYLAWSFDRETAILITEALSGVGRDEIGDEVDQFVDDALRESFRVAVMNIQKNFVGVKMEIHDPVIERNGRPASETHAAPRYTSVYCALGRLFEMHVGLEIRDRIVVKAGAEYDPRLLLESTAEAEGTVREVGPLSEEGLIHIVDCSTEAKEWSLFASPDMTACFLRTGAVTEAGFDGLRDSLRYVGLTGCESILKTLVGLVGKSPDDKWLCLAGGRPSDPGHRGEVRFENGFVRNKLRTPSHWRIPSVEPDSASHIPQFLRTGDPIARIENYREAVPGYDVLGAAIYPDLPATPGGQTAAGRGVRVSDDRLSFTAEHDGLLRIDPLNDRFFVEPCLDLEDVPAGGPEINEERSIYIRGNVGPNNRVVTTCDIYILGAAESGVLSAGGEVVVKEGVWGAQTGEIRAGKNIVVLHLNAASAAAGGNILAEKEIFCSSVAATNIMVPNGAIVGGRNMARGRVEARTIGREDFVGETVVGNTAVSKEKGDKGDAKEEKKRPPFRDPFKDPRIDRIKIEGLCLLKMNPTLDPPTRARLRSLIQDLKHVKAGADNEEPGPEISEPRESDRYIFVEQKIYPVVTARFGRKIVSLKNSVEGPLKIWSMSNIQHVNIFRA